MQPQQPMPPFGGPQQYGGIPPQMIAKPKKSFNILLIPLIISVLLLISAISFGAWAFSSRQDFKNNVDPKIAAAVEIAKIEVSTSKDKEFVEKEKEPLKEYKGPASFGTVTIKYPKTWSAYVNESAGAIPVDGYFHPNVVPGIQSGTSFALRIQVVNQKYDTELKQFESRVKTGKTTVAPYQAPLVKDASATGSRITGELGTNQQGTMVMFPLRDKTVKIFTESNQFVGDFDNLIMANLTFVP